MGKQIDVHATIVPNTTYYQKRTDMGLSMRAFHNWIKSSIIQRYIVNSKSVLDISCGRGGDFHKLFVPSVELYVSQSV